MRHPDTARNAKFENFARLANPTVTPSKRLLSKLGFSSHRQKVNIAATNVAAQAMSVVASPECARIGGNVVKRITESRAVSPPKYNLAHSQTTIVAITKKGRTPNLASVRFRSYASLYWSRLFPSWV